MEERGIMTVEEAVADLQRRQTSLQQEIDRDLRSAFEEIAQNNQKLSSNLEKLYQAKEKPNIEPLQQRLGHLKDTKKTIREITQKLRNITNITTQLSASSSPSPGRPRVSPMSVRNNEDNAVDVTMTQTAMTSQDQSPPLLPSQQPPQGILRGVGIGIADSASNDDDMKDTACNLELAYGTSCGSGSSGSSAESTASVAIGVTMAVLEREKAASSASSTKVSKKHPKSDEGQGGRAAKLLKGAVIKSYSPSQSSPLTPTNLNIILNLILTQIYIHFNEI